MHVQNGLMENTGIIDENTIIFNENFPPAKFPILSMEYLLLPFKQRGLVGLREIGTIHQLFPDVFLCTCLSIPGIMYLVTASSEPIWLRGLICAESLLCGVVSTLADGLLLYQSKDSSNRNGILGLDRVTSVIHIFTLIIMVIYRTMGSYISHVQLALALVVTLPSLFYFHRRLYFSFVEQDWKKARFCARIWHIGGTLASLILFLPKFA